MKYVGIALFLLILGGVFFVFMLLQPKNVSSPSPTPAQTMLGGDRDEHGCIPSAGYSWCEEKQKCLKTWEEVCASSDVTEKEINSLKAEIKNAIVEKRGSGAKSLEISISEVSGNYAKGGASEAGMGGGMWFAAKVNDKWILVWDGNGIITCEELKNYSEFPANMIPECFDTEKEIMVER